VVILTMTFADYRLKNKILTDRYNAMIFEKGKGREIYLVGGYIRDILRGINSPDRDYIVNGNIIYFVNEIRNIIGGTIVRFRKGDMTRLALKDGFTFDFSRPLGTLKQDLTKRDFTFNAIAWSPEKGIIDVCNGLGDLKKKKIRSLSKKNLISDPLRMLRAYRFAAELNGSIEKSTRKSIKTLHNNIKRISSERITLELFNLLNSQHSAKYLKMALSDGLLTDILSIPYKTLEHNIKEISLLEKTYIKKLPRKIKVILNKIFSQNLIYKGLLCLELLLKNGFISPVRAPHIKMSAITSKRIDTLKKGLHEFKGAKHNLNEKLFDIFQTLKETAMDILIIEGRLELIKDFIKFKRIWKKGVLSSGEIISISNVKTGPKLGKIIKELKKTQFEGRVKSRRSAINYIRNLSC
jgi:tRNA nucleotidyltransferase/poly(A) polymerase